jgi:hypothetical protein
MAYITESQVRNFANATAGVRFLRKAYSRVLKEEASAEASRSSFDIFLSHSLSDSEIVLGTKTILESTGKSVYVDWIVDLDLDRTKVTGATAEKLRARMKQCKAPFFLYSKSSQTSRWMPWELGFFDGHNGNVAVLPIVPDGGSLDFSKEEYLQLYAKVDFTSLQGKNHAWVNKSASVKNSVNEWMTSADKLRPSA